jgi:predicted nucleic acid-binding protein
VIVFLDTNVVVYHIEQPPLWGPRASARIAALRAAGDTLAVSDLVRMECIVGPLKRGDATMLAQFTAFFGSPDVSVLAITAAVCDKAARIRAVHSHMSLDALHLAAAIEHGCGQFLTADYLLKTIPDIPVDYLT